MNSLFNQIGQFRKNAEGKIPAQSLSHQLLEKTVHLLFPILCDDTQSTEARYYDMRDLLRQTLQQLSFDENRISTEIEHFTQSLESLYALMIEDATAIFNGDPAAKSIEEVVVTYPGFYAIVVYRLAHQLYTQNIPILPRLFTEYAHGKTGIDIHPAATIGHSFCIDHGTGIVIGETTVIGNNVKVYQGVTLGALSVSKEKAGTKRHPTIEDNATIYAGATILGGKTIVGHDSVIGGNVWLTKSVEPNTTVSNQDNVCAKGQQSFDIVNDFGAFI